MASSSDPTATSAPTIMNAEEEVEHYGGASQNPPTESIVISSLPKEKGWRTSHVINYKGFWHEDDFLPAILSLESLINPRPTDTIIASIPKSGTTWLMAVTFAITSRTRYSINDPAHPLRHNNPHHCVPIMESFQVNNRSSPTCGLPLTATHVPYPLLPRSIHASKCRILYVLRDPKDVLVSLWHFSSEIRSRKLLAPSSLEEAFERFARGASPSGPYWEHLLGYWKASLEHPETVMLIRYEDMKKDPAAKTKRIARFLGQPFSLEEERDGVVDGIIELCSFENLSNLEVNKSGMLKTPVPNSVLFRKGEEGDSKNYLSAEMRERLDRITEEKLEGSGLKL